MLEERVRPLKQDTETVVPDPINFAAFCGEEATAAALKEGRRVSLFGDAHPCREFKIEVVSVDSAESKWPGSEYTQDTRRRRDSGGVEAVRQLTTALGTRRCVALPA